MSTSHRLLKATRLLHLYLGVFTTPALLFFAFTGAIQTFSLHETTRGSDYKPPAILVQLSQLHKKQTLVVPTRKPAPPERPAERPANADKPTSRPATPDADKQTPSAAAAPTPSPTPTPGPTPRPTPAPPASRHNLLPMKLFFLLVAIGLVISTLTGLYMAYKYTRRPLTLTAVLIAGIAVPALLTLF